MDRTPQVLHTDAQPAACHVSCFALSDFPSWDRAVVPSGDLCSVWTPDDLGLAPVFGITPSKASLYSCSAQRLLYHLYHHSYKPFIISVVRFIILLGKKVVEEELRTNGSNVKGVTNSQIIKTQFCSFHQCHKSFIASF